MKCDQCGLETFLPFKCPYCGGYFCAEHRLPENHNCPRIDQAKIPKDVIQSNTVEWQRPTYTYGTVKPSRSRFHFSGKELEHLFVATVLVIGVGLSLFLYSSTAVSYLQVVFSAVAFTASFLLHEMAHKAVAQRHGLWAEFRLTTVGAIITAISIIPALPFKFIAPGAMMVAGAADQETMGRTAVAGPFTNLVLSAAFSSAAFILPAYVSVLGIVAWFNAWIAVFNLIPFGIFDGMKVFHWNKTVWVLMFAASVILMVELAITFLGL